MTQKIAIIGAGLSGLTIATRLQKNAEVVVFEKARGVGGRMSTRYADPFYFDHGTQFFTARTKPFKQFLSPFLESGLVQEWKGKVITFDSGRKTDRLWFEPHYVAVPHMNSLCKYLSDQVQVILNCEILPLGIKKHNQWELFDRHHVSQGTFDQVISTAPPKQTCRLFADYLPKGESLEKAHLLACYTLMLGFKKKWDHAWIAAKIHHSPLEWIAVNSSKPGRNQDLTSLVVHSQNSWAEKHCDDDLEESEKFLRDTLSEVLDWGDPDYCSLHRWRYALLDKAHDDYSRQLPYFDKTLAIGSVGDWCSRSRIEDVWTNAHQLCDRIERY
jgi:predicted NAD/FAD-dependent oxidoreductase